jgi:CXXX repeat peptide maturase
VLLGLDTATDDQLEMYRAAVQSLGEYVYRRYVANQSIELNVVSDRLMLRQMRNCNAGIDHLTVSPSGQFYLCPGFFHSQGLEYVGGTLATGPELRNNRLLELGNAPICRTCDAWHCKRCVWLNQRATLEVNTPSRQQCVAAHLERAVSHELRERLVAQDAAFGVFPPIGAGESLDPFDRVGARPTKKRIVSYPGAQTAAQSPTERQPADSNRDLLLEILRKQDEILALLKRQGAES